MQPISIRQRLYQAAVSAYIPLTQRDQWRDVTPIPQDDGPNPIVPIMYSEECTSIRVPIPPPSPTQADAIDRDAMDHFRAISVTKEHSERALELTETIIRINPAHYTVWLVWVRLTSN